MRKITKQTIQAFYNAENFKKSNSEVYHSTTENTTYMNLFDNTIAILSDGKLQISSCGYKTDTTKERLNGLQGVSISQKKGQWYLNGKEWNGKIITV